MHEHDWESLWLHLQAPHGPNLLITTKTTLNFHVQYVRLWVPLSCLSWKDIAGWYAARRHIHCCSSVSWPSLDVKRWLEDLLTASISLSWLTLCHFYKNNYQISCKMSAFFGLLPKHEMWCCGARRDIQWCLGDSCPSSDVWSWLEALLIASTSLLWSTPCHFCPKQLHNFMQNIIFQVPSQDRKYEDVLQWETSIAAQVSHNPP